MRGLSLDNILGFSVVFVFLAMEGIRDFKEKKISVTTTVIVGILGIILQLLLIKMPILSIVSGIVIGLALCGISVMTKGGVGIGDGLVFIVTGIILGGRKNVALLMFSLFLCACYGVFLLIFKKAEKKSTVAFIPFTLPAFVLVTLAGIG